MEAVIIQESESGGRVLQNREWHKVDGASADAIAALKSLAPVDLPESYYALLTFSNGGEGPLAVQPLWSNSIPPRKLLRLNGTGLSESFSGVCS